MKRFLWMVVAMATMIGFGACDDKPVVEPETEKVLEVTPATISALDVAGVYTFQIKASHSWTADCEADWVKLSKKWGTAGTVTVTLTVEESNAASQRTTTVVVESEAAELSREIKLTQAAISAERLANRKILYTTTDDKTIKPLNQYNVFGGPTIASNTYSNGQGVMTLTSEVKTVGSFAFRDQATLESMTLPKSVVEVGYNSFYNCPSLSSIELNEGLQTIGYMAFVHCDALVSVKIPQSVVKLGTSAFVLCRSLECFEGKYAAGEGRYLVANNEVVSFAPAGLTSTSLPEGVVAIQQEVFKECDALTEITLPATLTTIATSTFRDCAALASIELPSSVAKIGMGAFYGCESLSEIVVPETVTAIEMSTFENCSSLTVATLGSKVTKVAASAFKGCPLQSLVCKAVAPPETGANFLGGANDELVVRVPSEAVEAYKAAEGWKEYRIEAIE